MLSKSQHFQTIPGISRGLYAPFKQASVATTTPGICFSKYGKYVCTNGLDSSTPLDESDVYIMKKLYNLDDQETNLTWETLQYQFSPPNPVRVYPHLQNIKLIGGGVYTSLHRRFARKPDRVACASIRVASQLPVWEHQGIEVPQRCIIPNLHTTDTDMCSNIPTDTLDEVGKYAISGLITAQWMNHMQAMGYRVEPRTLPKEEQGSAFHEQGMSKRGSPRNPKKGRGNLYSTFRRHVATTARSTTITVKEQELLELECMIEHLVVCLELQEYRNKGKSALAPVDISGEQYDSIQQVWKTVDPVLVGLPNQQQFDILQDQLQIRTDLGCSDEIVVDAVQGEPCSVEEQYDWCVRAQTVEYRSKWLACLNVNKNTPNTMLDINITVPLIMLTLQRRSVDAQLVNTVIGMQNYQVPKMTKNEEFGRKFTKYGAYTRKPENVHINQASDYASVQQWSASESLDETNAKYTAYLKKHYHGGQASTKPTSRNSRNNTMVHNTSTRISPTTTSTNNNNNSTGTSTNSNLATNTYVPSYIPHGTSFAGVCLRVPTNPYKVEDSALFHLEHLIKPTRDIQDIHTDNHPFHNNNNHTNNSASIADLSKLSLQQILQILQLQMQLARTHNLTSMEVYNTPHGWGLADIVQGVTGYLGNVEYVKNYFDNLDDMTSLPTCTELLNLSKGEYATSNGNRHKIQLTCWMQELLYRSIQYGHARVHGYSAGTEYNELLQVLYMEPQVNNEKKYISSGGMEQQHVEASNTIIVPTTSSSSSNNNIEHNLPNLPTITNTHPLFQYWLRLLDNAPSTTKSTTPQDILSSLEETVIGQSEAKRSVSIALRNRERKKNLSHTGNNITPKNILLSGPTGCGKSEIARTLATITQSPFLKVEATKYTETGFHGKDVDTIIKDQVDVAVGMLRLRNGRKHAKSSAIKAVATVLSITDAELPAVFLEIERRKNRGDLSGGITAPGIDTSNTNTLITKDLSLRGMKSSGVLMIDGKEIEYNPSSTLQKASLATENAQLESMAQTELAKLMSNHSNSPTSPPISTLGSRRDVSVSPLSEKLRKLLIVPHDHHYTNVKGYAMQPLIDFLQPERVKQGFTKQQLENMSVEYTKRGIHMHNSPTNTKLVNTNTHLPPGMPISASMRGLQVAAPHYQSWIEELLATGFFDAKIVELDQPSKLPESVSKLIDQQDMHIIPTSTDTTRVSYQVPICGALQLLEMIEQERGSLSRHPNMNNNPYNVFGNYNAHGPDAMQADLVQEAVKLAERDGIVFIDEIDKICIPAGTTRHSGDASDEGVQRDLLPIIEGSVVQTTHGAVNTANILFLAAGAFTVAKPSDLLPELLGRLPIQIKLKELSKQELYRLLCCSTKSQLKQYTQLLAAEDVNLYFSNDAIIEFAHAAVELNSFNENIGARRLHALIEKVLEDVSFDASTWEKNSTFIVTKEMIQNAKQNLLTIKDQKKYCL